MHWTIRKATWLFSIGSGTTPSSEDTTYYNGDVPWITTSELRESVVVSTGKMVTEKALATYSSLRLHPKGSVAVAMYGATIGRLGILGRPATVNQACCVFSNPQGIDMRFWFYWLRMRRAYLVSLGYGGGQPNLSQELLRAIRAAIPPETEQADIVSFLDGETAKIDALVEKKERLIELLQEKRIALITHAVTKGLDPNLPMKDSGIEWLGQIPAHWEAGRIKTVARLESGHTPSRQHPEYWEDCTVPWFGLADVWQIRDDKVEYVQQTNEKVSELGLANSSARKLPKGTVILSRTASVGFSAIMGKDMATTQDFANWVPGPELQSEYLLYVLRAMRNELGRLVMGSTHKTIYMPDISALTTPVPPRREQEKIVAYIRSETATIDALIAKVGEAIERLKEYRTALISAAVTGKIDVREVVR